MAAGQHYVRELDSLTALYRSGGCLDRAVVQGLDLREAGIDWGSMTCEAAVFLGSDYASVVTGAALDVNGGEYMPI